MTDSQKTKLATLFCLTLVTVVFLKNFWITEDTFILFRMLEQMRAGHGMVWNTGVRSQAFTSVGWFFVMALYDKIISDVFISTTLANISIFFVFILIVWKIFKEKIFLFCAFLVFLLPSKSFFDYTSSGLDNAFGYATIALLYYLYKKQGGLNKENLSKNSFLLISLLTISIVFARYEFVIFSIPPFIYLIWAYRPRIPFLIKTGILSSLPLLAWTLFSLIYYGKPLPNTAYAKLNHGLPESYVLPYGINYFVQHLIADPYSMAIIFLGIISGIVYLEPWKKAFAIGCIVDLFYIIDIGGDYMLGRFISYPFLVSLLLLTDAFIKYSSFQYATSKKLALLMFSLPFAGLIVPENPAITPWGYGRNTSWMETADADIARGIINMRKNYYQTSAAAWFYGETRSPMSLELTDVKAGLDIKNSGEPVAVIGAAGATGYYAGLDVYLIDTLSWTDPFTSMLPAIKMMYASHFEREIPQGYAESFTQKKSSLADANLDEYYQHIKFITTSKDLFSFDRLEAIYKLNTGQYDYLLDAYRADIIQRRDLTPPNYKIRLE